MKIAICYSGMFRNFKENVDNNIKHLISKYDSDVYLSFWDIYGFSTFRTKFDIKNNDEILDDAKEDVLNKLKPKNFEFESYSKLNNFFEEESNKYTHARETPPPYCKNMLSMWYKVEKCGKMVEDSGINYDLIIRLRGDISFNSDLILQQPKENTIYSPLQGSWNSSMNDQIAYGNKDVMHIYSDLYNKLPNIWLNSGTSIAPEAILYKHMENNNILMESFDLYYNLLDEHNNKR